MKKKIGLPLDSICPQFWGRSSADSPLKIWDVFDTFWAKKQKIDNFDQIRLNDPLKISYC